LKHYVSPKFWALYEALPQDVRELADKNYKLLRIDSRHPSPHFKKIGELWSVRIGAHYRAIATEVDGGMYWIWIGTHADYDAIVS